MKVTDFLLAQHIIKDVCKMEGVTFVDVSVSFDEAEEGLQVIESQHICHTLYQIISLYISNSEKITGKILIGNEKRRDDFLESLLISLTSVATSGKTYTQDIKELSLQGLYQRPLIWIIMKDIICPMYDIVLENIRVVSGNNPQVDIVKYYAKGEIDVGDFENYPFIFINEIENKPVLNALILIETLRAFGLEPEAVLLDIFESEVFDKLDGLLRLSFNDNFDGKEVFIHTLINVLRINNNCKVITAQSADEKPDRQNQFWFLGLVEGMLDKTRGSDWSTYKSLQPYVESFWKKVEKLKIAKKGQNVTFNELLQLKREEGTTGVDVTRTLQELLSSDRIW